MFPTWGPPSGVYSDILLHDMGHELIDLNHAEPYRVGVTPVRLVSTTSTTSQTADTNTTGYYGGSSSMTTTSTQTSGSTGSAQQSNQLRFSRGYSFVAPSYPAKMKIVDLGSKTTN